MWAMAAPCGQKTKQKIIISCFSAKLYNAVVSEELFAIYPLQNRVYIYLDCLALNEYAFHTVFHFIF